ESVGQELSAPVKGNVVDRSVNQRRGAKPGPMRRGISGRERESLKLVAEGRSSRESAASLYVSMKTIETHRKQIMDKLNLHSVAELTKYAIREGVTSL